MELRMSFNTNIKLKNPTKINDISGEILDYQLNERELTGVFNISGSYFKDDLSEVHTFKEEVPFNILFMENNIDLEDIDCIDLDYCLIEGQGLDVTFDLQVEYSVLEDEEYIEEERLSLVTDETDIEEIKEEITKEIEQKLSDSLLYKDNEPTEVSIVSRINDVKKNIKVIYYDNDFELEKACKENNVSLTDVFKDNKTNDIDKYLRVIIK